MLTELSPWFTTTARFVAGSMATSTGLVPTGITAKTAAAAGSMTTASLLFSFTTTPRLPNGFTAAPTFPTPGTVEGNEMAWNSGPAR